MNHNLIYREAGARKKAEVHIPELNPPTQRGLKARPDLFREPVRSQKRRDDSHGDQERASGT
jgi:hypothetical protein